MAALTDGGDVRVLDSCARSIGFVASALGVRALLSYSIVCWLIVLNCFRIFIIYIHI